MTPDRKLALVVASLFRDCPPHKPRGTVLWPGMRARLLEDKPLTAYLASVVEADGWTQERLQMGRYRAGSHGEVMSVCAIAAMLPTWRQWGQMLVDADKVPDFEGMFVPPGGSPVTGGRCEPAGARHHSPWRSGCRWGQGVR